MAALEALLPPGEGEEIDAHFEFDAPRFYDFDEGSPPGAAAADGWFDTEGPKGAGVRCAGLCFCVSLQVVHCLKTSRQGGGAKHHGQPLSPCSPTHTHSRSSQA